MKDYFEIFRNYDDLQYQCNVLGSDSDSRDSEYIEIIIGETQTKRKCAIHDGRGHHMCVYDKHCQC